MAHFAELDADNVVMRVLVVGNADTADADGVEDATIGVAFLNNLFPGSGAWLQTSYNNSIHLTKRKHVLCNPQCFKYRIFTTGNCKSRAGKIP